MDRTAINRYLIFSMLLALLFIHSGCGKKKEGKLRQKKIRIVYCNWENLPVQRIASEKIIEAFEKEHPDIGVIFQAPPGRQGMDKILVQIVGGTPPDVFFWISNRLPPLAEKRVVLDLKPFIEKDPDFNINDFFDIAIKDCSYDNSIYALPTHLDSYALYYNKTLFDKAGLGYPDDSWTWNDCIKVAIELTKDTDGDGRIDQYGIYRFSELWILAGQERIDFFSEDGTKCLVDNQKMVDIVRFDTDLANKYRVCPKSQATLLGDLVTAFSTGKIGMFTAGSYLLSELRLFKAHNL